MARMSYVDDRVETMSVAVTDVPSSQQDIGIAIKDYRPELIDVFTMNDLMLMHSFGRVNDSFELSFRNEDTKLDIFFFYEESDHVWNGGTRSV